MRIWAFLLGQRFSASVAEADVYDNLLGDAKFAEEIGLDGVWVAEHHFVNYSIVPNGLTLAAAIAASTERIKVGTAVSVLPLHHPVRVAEELAMVDQISDGRADIGFGRGYSAFEYNGLGIDISEAAQVFEDNVDIILSLLSQHDAPRVTPTRDLPARTLVPQARPDILDRVWLACGSTRSMARALQRKLGIVVRVGVNGASDVERSRAEFEAACAEHGAVPAAQRFGVQVVGRVVENGSELEAAADDARALYRVAARMVRADAPVVHAIVDSSGTEPTSDVPLEQVLGGSLIGSDEQVRDQIVWLEQLGVTDLSINFRFGQVDTATVRRSMATVSSLAGKSAPQSAAVASGGAQ